MLPTDTELTRARADLEAAMLPDTCNILSAVHSVDAMGGISDTWGTAKVNVACRIDSLTGKEILSAGEIMPYNTYVMTLPQSASITTDSRVEHGDYTYEVKSVSLDRSWSWCKRAMVERT
jgi:head-tail adaptor